jgi:hypothetical protein
MTDNPDRFQFYAFIATLVALAFVFDSALVAASINGGIMGKLEVFGLGTITGGLIGVLKAPTRSTGASDATVSAALNKLPDAPPVPAITPVVIQQPADQPVPVAPANEGA